MAFDEDFPGKLLPFGCRVSYRPSTAKQLDRGKWDPVMSAGVFAGYKLRPGSHWRDEYYVWDLTGFAAFDLAGVCGSLTPQLRRPHVTGRVWLYKDTLAFPLRQAYDEARATLHGVRRPVGQRGDPEHPYDCPPIPADEEPEEDSAVDASHDVPPPPPDTSAVRGAGVDGVQVKPAHDVPDRRHMSGWSWKAVQNRSKRA